MTQTSTYEQKIWSLEDLFPAADAPDFKDKFEAAFTEIETLAADIERYRSRLHEDISNQEFLEVVQKLEATSRRGSELATYPGLLFASDTQDQNALALLGRVEKFLADMRNKTLFFELWFKALPDDEAGRLIAASGDYHYWLEQMRQFKPHTLSEAEEKIINIKDVTGASAIKTLYDSITNRYVYKVEVEGEVKELTRGELMALVRTDDPDLRARAYQELYKVYGDDGPILGQIYQTLVRDWRNENLDLRSFKSPISVRNLVNDIPDEVVETLMEVSKQNASIFQRFFKLKARWLGVDKLRRYDIYAPPAAESKKEYAYADGAAMVLDSFGQFDPKVAELAEKVFAADHIDSEVRKGKMGGAFCATASPDLVPWVLLNYQGKADDVATMAHELGHAIHSLLASDHTQFTFYACLPLAETASTFGEMLLVDRLLAEEQDEAVRRDILFRVVDENYATVMRQIFFALFEAQAHQMIADNATVDELADAYMENLRLQFSDAVDVPDEFRWEWVSIPHIYDRPFYVYAYSFGQLLVLSLYQQFREEGEAFKPRYLKILSAGGSVAPAKLLADAGIDITQASFWQGGYDVLDRMVKDLELFQK